MMASSEFTPFSLDDFVTRQQDKELLRFIVCGSVDQGKSTLIGRLLYETKSIFDDQLDTLSKDSRNHGTQRGDLDLALLLDGLAAEREQKITIDVAYRFFATDRRKFVVVDAPGHEQYTRNMATGASTADLALLVISAETRLTRQTKRHLSIVSALGVRQIVAAVNKMDLVGWSHSAFAKLEAEFRTFVKDLNFDDVSFIPVAAAVGDNVVSPSGHMDWYRGPTLLDHLEQVPIAHSSHGKAFRMPVQWVNRPDPGFRGYSGLVAGGEVYPDMRVQVLPSGQWARVGRIVTADGDLNRAVVGQAVTLTLAGEIDVSRGDMIAEADVPLPVTDRLCARLVWLGEEPLTAGKLYLLKLATGTATAKLEPGLRVFDLETRESRPADCLQINGIGIGILALDRPIAADRYADNKETGSFILIDPESYDTVGLGMVDEVLRTESRRPTRIGASITDLIHSSESHARSIAKAASWRMTGSLDTFIIATFVTGNTKAAGAVALAEILTKTALYYFHERVWLVLPWGKRTSGRKRTRAVDASRGVPSLVSSRPSGFSFTSLCSRRMQCKDGNGLPCVGRVDVKQKLRHVRRLSLFRPVALTEPPQPQSGIAAGEVGPSRT
jgi:sulfate adenylyltransferase large subunit